MDSEKKQQEIIQIVKARLSTMPKEAILSIGSYGEFKRDDLIKQVEQNTEIGKKIILSGEVQSVGFLKSRFPLGEVSKPRCAYSF